MKSILKELKPEPQMQRALLCFPSQGGGWVLCYKGSDFQEEHSVMGESAFNIEETGIAEDVSLNSGLVVIDFTVTYSGGDYNAYVGDYDDPYVIFNLKSERRPTAEELTLIVEGNWDKLIESWSDIEPEEE